MNMEVNILRLKASNNSIFGIGEKKEIFILNNNKWLKTEFNFKWDYDFEIYGERIFYIRERKVFFVKNNKLNETTIDFNFHFPSRLKFYNKKLFILDKELSKLFIFKENFELETSFFMWGADIFENEYSPLIDCPHDFDIINDKIAIIDIGNRRTVYLDDNNFFEFPVIGEKIRFLSDKILILLHGEEFYKIDIEENSISKKTIKNLLDFETLKNEIYLLKK